MNRDQIEVHEEPAGVTVLALSGELDIVRTPAMGVAINEILRSRPLGLVIDLCAVTFADSTALALLLNAQRRATQRGLAMHVACDVQLILEILSLTRLDREFRIHPTRELAIKAARSG